MGYEMLSGITGKNVRNVSAPWRYQCQTKQDGRIPLILAFH
jgi:hypothetical protein